MIEDFPPEYGKLPEFVKCCRRLRERETTYSEDEFFYFIATSIETLTEDKLDDLFREKYATPLKEIREKAGLQENEYWKPGDPKIPDEYLELLDDFRKEKRSLLAKSFKNFVEAAMSTLVEEDYELYLARREKGKETFYSRHKFEAVRMEPSEMNPELFEPEEEASETEPNSDPIAPENEG